MPKTREELQQLLNVLSRAMPSMIDAHPDEADFWPAFAGEADVIQDEASASDYEWTTQQIDNILKDHGKPISTDLPPSDDLPPS